MIRFQPDTWLDGLLRPLLLADPSAGLYYEDGAPDWRFALLLVLALALALTRRRRAPALAWAALGLLMAVFYLWTFSIGNGRYLMPCLLLAGPLLVVFWRQLPGTRGFRWLLLAGLAVLQVWTVQNLLRPNAWGLVKWHDGPAIRLSASPLREQPIAVVTISSISYSLLVPFFHPASRWINVSGQVPLRPHLPEWQRARALLGGPLPLYLLVPADTEPGAATVPDTPSEATWGLIEEALVEQGLARRGNRCETLTTNLLPHGEQDPAKPKVIGAFWLCPLQLADPAGRAPAPVPDPYADVFARVEAVCPRFFAPGAAQTRAYTGFWQRYYLSADMRLIVDEAGNVLYRYFRHFTPVRIASVAEVRSPGWQFDCTRLKGRYRPPWVADD